jgi:hypothetical protein
MPHIVFFSYWLIRPQEWWDLYDFRVFPRKGRIELTNSGQTSTHQILDLGYSLFGKDDAYSFDKAECF